TSDKLGVLPSPLWGGVGGGGPSADHRTTPTPALRADPPHKGRVGPSTRHFTPNATTDRARPSWAWREALPAAYRLPPAASRCWRRGRPSPHAPPARSAPAGPRPPASAGA